MYVVSERHCFDSRGISTIQEHIACAGKPISALILGGSIEAGADLQNPLDSYFVRALTYRICCLALPHCASYLRVLFTYRPASPEPSKVHSAEPTHL